MSTNSNTKTAKPKTEEKVFDPFDPEALKLSEKDRRELGVQITLVELQCRKPGKQEWVRTNPELVLDTSLLKLEDSGEFYLVPPDLRLHSDIFEMAKPYRIQLAVTRAGSPFLWPAVIPEDGGAGASWHRSALQCQKLAETEWTRVVSDRGANAYVPRTTTADLPDPKWPDNNMRSLLELSFRARVIDSPDHAILKMLRGEE